MADGENHSAKLTAAISRKLLIASIVEFSAVCDNEGSSPAI